MIRTLIRAALCVAALLVAAPAVMAAEPKVPTTAAAPKVPATPEDHFALAKQYQEKATTYRAEAQTHREMAAAYKKNAQFSHAVARGQKDPRVEKAVAHCNNIATTAEKLATENEKAAEYHTFRGKELQGK